MATNSNETLNVQPHSDEAETAVLGSMLSSKEAVSKTIPYLEPGHFYKDGNGKIYSTMLQLFEKGEPVDTVSVLMSLKKIRTWNR